MTGYALKTSSFWATKIEQLYDRKRAVGEAHLLFLIKKGSNVNAKSVKEYYIAPNIPYYTIIGQYKEADYRINSMELWMEFYLEVEKTPKASKPSAAGPSRVLAAYEDSLEDEEVSNHDQGLDSNDNEDKDVNHDGVAPPKLQCYWKSGEENDSPSKVNEARTKECNDIEESSSSDTMSDNGGEGMNVDYDDDSHGTSNYPLQSGPLLETPTREPPPTSTKKTLEASSLEKPMGQKQYEPPSKEVMFVDLTMEQEGESIANTNPPSTLDDVQCAEDSSLGNQSTAQVLTEVKKESTKDYWAQEEKKWAEKRARNEEEKQHKKAKKKALREKIEHQREVEMEEYQKNQRLLQEQLVALQRSLQLVTGFAVSKPTCMSYSEFSSECS